MGIIIFQIILVIFLSLASGFFAGSEIALISLRKTRTAALVKRSNRRAKVVQDLQKNLETLFATTQIGISLLTIFTSAFAGSSFAQKLSPLIARIPWSFTRHYSYGISFIAIVMVVSYISLLFGELVPKSIAVRYTERLALLAAYPVWWFSNLFYPLIKILNLSSNFILKPVKNSITIAEAKLSEEEIRILIAESKNAGAIEAREQEMLENVFEFSNLSVDRIMLPRAQVLAFSINADWQETIRHAIESGFSRIPIYRHNLDHIVGILYIKDLLKYLYRGEKVNLEKILIPPFFVPNTQRVSDVLQLLQHKKFHMALVTNEHGEVEGLVTLEDIVEEIVGDISDESDEAQKNVVKEKDGSFTVSGSMPIMDFNRYFKSDLPETEQYTAISGFILNDLERFPEIGDVVKFQNLEFVVKDKTDRTVKEITVKRKATDLT